jgi:hypothetical protein
LEERIHIVRKTLSLFVAVAGLSFAAPTLTIIPSIGPISGTPSGDAYALNALNALRLNLTTFGAVGPSQYNRFTGVLNPNQVVDTTGAFNSWLGNANPAAPFNNEFGNALYYGIQWIGANSSEQVSLSNFVFVDGYYSDPAVSIPYNTPADTYDGTTIIGVQYGTDGLFGTADDIVVNSGQANTTPVNALFYRGYNVSFGPFPSLPGTPQQQLDAYVGSQAAIVAAFGPQTSSAQGNSTSGNASANAVIGLTTSIPEPSTYALIGIGLAALAYVRRRAA